MGDRTDELAVIDQQAPLALFGTTDPLEVIATAAKVATALAEVVNERKLYAIVNGKKFPTVEAWTLLGSMLGVFPITEWVHELRDDNGAVRGFEARVRAQTLSGRIVGAGEARCVRGESKTWHSGAQEFALSSMAQTRATSKALRGPLDFVFKLAGFQPTPAEEMTVGSAEPVDQDGVIANPSAESLKAVQSQGVPAPSSSGPAPTVTSPDERAGRSERPAGPRAKRGNIVRAPQGAQGGGEAADTAPANPAVAPSPPVALDDEPEDGKAEYLATLRQQARESAAVLRQLRIRKTNHDNREAIALGSAQAVPVPEAKPSTDSDESLAAYIAETFKGKTLATLDESEFATMLAKFEDLTKSVEAKLK